jgi:transcriptional activator of cad operon
MNSTSIASLRVGAWRVDPTSWEIAKDGNRVRLEARTMRLLLCLAERPGSVVSIETLLDQVWTGVIVTPASVYQAVASLRRILGDDARQPTYIETVPRLGYRLLAPVSPWVDESIAPAAQTDRHGLGRRFRVKSLFASASVLGLAIVGVFWFYGGSLAHLARPAAPQKSVAVLPLLDLTSNEMNEEVFADGMTEELIDKLSKIRGLRVPAPTSSFLLKGTQQGVADIAKSLGVTYVIDGSVRKSDVTLRVAVRLIRADDGYVVWSETYDRPLSDKLMVQDDIATQVAKALKSSLT